MSAYTVTKRIRKRFGIKETLPDSSALCDVCGTAMKVSDGQIKKMHSRCRAFRKSRFGMPITKWAYLIEPKNYSFQ